MQTDQVLGAGRSVSSALLSGIRKTRYLYRAQLVDISKLGLNSKIKKFSYSFFGGKGYSPPFGGE